MTVEWYAAHVITSIRTKNKKRKWINLYETIFLVKGRTGAEAWKKAEKLGKQEAMGYSAGGTLDDGTPAKIKYEGIRKLMRVMNTYEHDPEINRQRPNDGTDLTHSQFGVRNQDELKKLVRGKQVTVEYYEQKPAPTAKRKRKRKS